jgi:serine/threonine protein phosphatase 1
MMSNIEEKEMRGGRNFPENLGKERDAVVSAELEGRLLAVGDLHGCSDLLDQLLKEVAPEDRDQMVFLGDYVDRGPDGRGVIERLLELQRRWPQTVFLRGNHEQMFLDYLEDRQRLPFLINGGQTTLESYGGGKLPAIPDRHRDFLHSLPTRYERDDFIFVHAGLRPGIPLADQDEEDLLWIRGEFLDSDFDWGKTIVFGHTPLERPFLAERRIGVDTGAVYGRALTCCDVLSRRIWQVG